MTLFVTSILQAGQQSLVRVVVSCQSVVVSTGQAEMSTLASLLLITQIMDVASAGAITCQRSYIYTHIYTRGSLMGQYEGQWER